MSKKSAKKVLAWWQSGEGGSAYPQERLADFEDLLDRRVSQHLLEAPEEQVEKIRRLHAEFRNPFAHFVPMGWAIEKSGLPQMIKAAMQRLLRANLCHTAALLPPSSSRRMMACCVKPTGSEGGSR
jgi:hypothetical protein